MLDVTQIHSLSDFQRNAKAHIRRLKKTGRPELLTVNGQAEIVIQDASAYQQLIEAAEEFRALSALGESLSQADRKEGRLLRDVLAELAASAGIDFPK